MDEKIQTHNRKLLVANKISVAEYDSRQSYRTYLYKNAIHEIMTANPSLEVLRQEWYKDTGIRYSEYQLREKNNKCRIVDVLADWKIRIVSEYDK